MVGELGGDEPGVRHGRPPVAAALAPRARMARTMSSGRMGSLVNQMPVAFWMAAATAPGTGFRAASPMPLAPMGPVGS